MSDKGPLRFTEMGMSSTPDNGDGTKVHHGIIGMTRARRRSFGGTLKAGPRPEGGFEVLARLPLGAVTS